MNFFSRIFGSLFQQQSESTLVITILEFPKPRGLGVFEIRLGKTMIFTTEYDFEHSSVEAIKQKMDSKNIDLKVIKFDAIKFNNISQFGQREITAWMKKSE